MFAYFKPSSTKKGLTAGLGTMKKKDSFNIKADKVDNRSQNKIIKN